jgi:signal transduction histidine kinase
MNRTERTMRRHQATSEAAKSQQISHLLGRLIAAQETERSRIARDLHDDVSQRIAGLSIMISGVKRTLGDKPDHADVMTALTSMQQGMVALADDIRQLSHDLHPALLQCASLDTALRAFCAQFQNREAIDVTYRGDRDTADIGADMALCLYRIAQEAFRNVAKHADAQHVGVVLTRTLHGVQLSIVDDGRGFDLANARGPGRGLGLVSIDERARLLGGRARVETQPQRGTCVHVEIPWPSARIQAWRRQSEDLE